TGGTGAGARRARRPGRGLRETALDPAGGAIYSPLLRANHDALFFAGPGNCRRAEPGRDARRPSGHYSARSEQPAVRAMGFAGDVVASVGAWVPDLADAAAIRSLQSDAGG